MSSIVVKFVIDSNDQRFTELHKELTQTNSKKIHSKIIKEILIRGHFRPKINSPAAHEAGISIQLTVTEYSPCLDEVYVSLESIHDHSKRVSFLKNRIFEILSGKFSPNQMALSEQALSVEIPKNEVIPSSVKSALDTNRGAFRSQIDQFNKL